MGERQTSRFLADRLAAAGLRPLSRFGQNFLIDLNLVDLIAKSAGLRETDVGLEIGTGVGSLTTRLSDAACAVVSAEIDHNLFRLASAELADRPNVRLIQGDALKNKGNLRPELLDSVREAMTRIGPKARFLLVANLPYNVATPIVSNLLGTTPSPDVIVVTIQKELADRMIAAPNTKDYGALSVWVQSLCHVEIVRDLPPTVFWPRPKVQSSIVRLTADPVRRAAIPDLTFFHDTCRALFFHRRKFLRSVIISATKDRLDKAQVDQLLATTEYGPETRIEQMSIEQIAGLIEKLRLFLIDTANE